MLHERIAVVTGASRGIGRAVALALARHGADVACLSRDLPATERVAAEVAALGRRSVALPCDVTSDASVAEAVAATVARLGPVDILVNNAGVAESAPFMKTDRGMWARHLDVNLTGTYRMIQEVLPGMLARHRGRIVNVASVAGRIGFAYTSAYCASKHAVVGLTRALAQEIATSGVTVNAVCPGWVDTGMSDRAVANIAARTGREPGEARRALADMSPQKRLMTPEEVAHAVVMLVADAAAGIHGQAIAVDGGGMQK